MVLVFLLDNSNVTFADLFLYLVSILLSYSSYFSSIHLTIANHSYISQPVDVIRIQDRNAENPTRRRNQGGKRMNGYHHLNGHPPGAGQPSTSTGNDVVIPAGPTNQPRVLLRKLDNTDAVFQLSGVETGYANSLRRVMMADVPTIGESLASVHALACARAPPFPLCAIAHSSSPCAIACSTACRVRDSVPASSQAIACSYPPTLSFPSHAPQ